MTRSYEKRRRHFRIAILAIVGALVAIFFIAGLAGILDEYGSIQEVILLFVGVALLAGTLSAIYLFFGLASVTLSIGCIVTGGLCFHTYYLVSGNEIMALRFVVGEVMRVLTFDFLDLARPIYLAFDFTQSEKMLFASFRAVVAVFTILIVTRLLGQFDGMRDLIVGEK